MTRSRRRGTTPTQSSSSRSVRRPRHAEAGQRILHAGHAGHAAAQAIVHAKPGGDSIRVHTHISWLIHGTLHACTSWKVRRQQKRKALSRPTTALGLVHDVLAYSHPQCFHRSPQAVPCLIPCTVARPLICRLQQEAQPRRLQHRLWPCPLRLGRPHRHRRRAHHSAQWCS